MPSPRPALTLPVGLVLALASLHCSSDGGGPERCDPSAGSCARVAREASDLIPGPKATGQPGDVVLENALARFVVQRPLEHIQLASQFGGNLIDADVKRVADRPGADAFGELSFLANFGGTLGTREVTVEDPGGPGREAVVVARGGYELNGYLLLGPAVESVLGFDLFAATGADPDASWPLAFELRYRLPPDASALRVELTVTNAGDVDVPFVNVWFAQGGLVEAFVSPGPGFGLPPLGLADGVYFEGIDPERSVAYGLLPDGAAALRPAITLLGANAVAHSGDPADLLRFPRNARDVLAPGASLTQGAWFVVGRDLDAARAIGAALARSTRTVTVAGRVVEEGNGRPLADVDVSALRGGAGGGATLTNARSDADGGFRLTLAPGPVRLIAGQEGRPYAGGGATPREVPLRVDESGAGGEVLLELPATARLVVDVSDSTGAPMPARLTVLGVDPSPPDARLAGDGFDPLAPGVLRMEDAIDGRFDLRVEPGEVDVVVSRGLEYEIDRRPLRLAAGETRSLSVRLDRVIDTNGFLAGDFHVHSNPGPDSTVTYVRRVENMLAEGVEVIGATDHAFVSDYWPTIDALGVRERIATIAGQEITTFATGHFGAFPLERGEAPNGGAVNWVGLDPASVAETVHARNPRAIVQIMHPRAMPAPGNISNLFTSIDLVFDANGPRLGPAAVEPSRVRLPPDARWLTREWDAMEVVTFANVQGLADWFNLLEAGWRVTGMGNSDTHTQWVEASGYARNLVRQPDGLDDPARFDEAAYVDAIRAGANSITLGAFVDLAVRRADGRDVARLGETLDASGGPVEVEVRVQSPAWLAANRVTLYEGALPVAEVELPLEPVAVGPEGARRLEGRLLLRRDPGRDTWYAAAVTGERSLYPLLPYNTAERNDLDIERIRANDLPGTLAPFSVTNPVWVDADGDGSVEPGRRIVPQDCQEYPRVDRTNPYVVVPERNCPCAAANDPQGC